MTFVRPTFSHAEASALLPLVRDVFARVRPAHEKLQVEARELTRLGVDPFALRAVGPEELPEEAARRRQRLHELAREIDDALGELIELGIEVKGADGLVDFPSRHAERVVSLCWRWDEPALGWWHELDAGFAGRQPVGDPGEFVGDDPH